MNPNSSISLNLAAIAACILCSYCYIKTACYYWRPKFNPGIYSFITACLIGTVLWRSSYWDNEILACLLVVLFEVLILRFGTDASNPHALLASIASVFHNMCIKGIAVGLFALFLQKNMYQIITVSDSHLSALILTMLLKLCAPLLYRSAEVRRKFLVLFRSEHELEAVLWQHSALFIIMLFFSYNYYYNLDLIWFTMAQIIFSALMLALYYFILYYSIRISNLLENEIANTRIRQQLNAQLARYSSYQTIFKQLEGFKYQFRESMLATEELISSGSIEAAKNTLHSAIPQLLEYLPSKKVYSNHELLNAMLLDWDTHCQTDRIQFDSTVYLPPSFQPKEKVVLSAFAIVEDMFSYIVPASGKPFIKVEGKMLQGNFVLSVTGSIQGTVERKGDFPHFTIPNAVQVQRLYHKLLSVSEAVNGILFWNHSDRDRTFQIIFSLHQ